MALGRGPLRAVMHRRHDEALQRCPYGCNAKESAEHVVMGCHITQHQRNNIIKICKEMELEFNMQTVFCEIAIKDELGTLIKTFIKT